jgi:hypothetical protein
MPNKSTPSTYIRKPHTDISQHPNKRQRTSEDEDSSPPYPTPNPLNLAKNGAGASRTDITNTPILSMMQVRAEDAGSKFPKKVPVAAAQAKWEQLQPNKNRKPGDHGESAGQSAEEDTPMTDAPATRATTAAAGSDSRREAITIDSSSDSEDIQPRKSGSAVAGNEINADKLLPSAESTESEGSARRPSASRGGRGRFMARRGGRRKWGYRISHCITEREDKREDAMIFRQHASAWVASLLRKWNRIEFTAYDTMRRLFLEVLRWQKQEIKKRDELYNLIRFVDFLWILIAILGASEVNRWLGVSVIEGSMTSRFLED